MFDHESIASVNPLATRDEQLANIRQIYPPEREALGVVAIGIELLDHPPTRLTPRRVWTQAFELGGSTVLTTPDEALR